jgi:hypothetical protein
MQKGFFYEKLPDRLSKKIFNFVVDSKTKPHTCQIRTISAKRTHLRTNWKLNPKREKRKKAIQTLLKIGAIFSRIKKCIK